MDGVAFSHSALGVKFVSPEYELRVRALVLEAGFLKESLRAWFSSGTSLRVMGQ
jgi:hypothetical protein